MPRLPHAELRALWYNGTKMDAYFSQLTRFIWRNKMRTNKPFIDNVLEYNVPRV